MKVYVDANPTQLCYVMQDEDGYTHRPRCTTIEEQKVINVAEFMAVNFALRKVKGDLTIFTDSQSVFQYLNGKTFKPNEKYQALMTEYIELTKGRNIAIANINRRDNFAGKVLDKKKQRENRQLRREVQNGE